MHVTSSCTGLFVDNNNSIYCSQSDHHQVVKKQFNENMILTSVIAGTGINGTSSDMLSKPHGIFVDNNFDLYVADLKNNRIQLFPLGQKDGLTILGSESLIDSVPLNCPTGVILDADKHLFVVDQYNQRIIRSGSTGWQCIIGCSRSSGSSPEKLSFPITPSFDTYGNLYVVDANNHRIQKFLLFTNSCGKYKAFIFD